MAVTVEFEDWIRIEFATEFGVTETVRSLCIRTNCRKFRKFNSLRFH